mmetsp:Transcript_50785/g.163289  ORF Transcript_50785/g.163289 Transcript_50785/m.163289 type:complete len:249 (+) Transcript_50785:494-1240(+)
MGGGGPGGWGGEAGGGTGHSGTPAGEDRGPPPARSPPPPPRSRVHTCAPQQVWRSGPVPAGVAVRPKPKSVLPPGPDPNSVLEWMAVRSRTAVPPCRYMPPPMPVPKRSMSYPASAALWCTLDEASLTAEPEETKTPPPLAARLSRTVQEVSSTRPPTTYSPPPFEVYPPAKTSPSRTTVPDRTRTTLRKPSPSSTAPPTLRARIVTSFATSSTESPLPVYVPFDRRMTSPTDAALSTLCKLAPASTE